MKTQLQITRVDRSKREVANNYTAVIQLWRHLPKSTRRQLAKAKDVEVKSEEYLTKKKLAELGIGVGLKRARQDLSTAIYFYQNNLLDLDGNLDENIQFTDPEAYMIVTISGVFFCPYYKVRPHDVVEIEEGLVVVTTREAKKALLSEPIKNLKLAAAKLRKQQAKRTKELEKKEQDLERKSERLSKRQYLVTESFNLRDITESVLNGIEMSLEGLQEILDEVTEYITRMCHDHPVLTSFVNLVIDTVIFWYRCIHASSATEIVMAAYSYSGPGVWSMIRDMCQVVLPLFSRARKHFETESDDMKRSTTSPFAYVRVMMSKILNSEAVAALRDLILTVAGFKLFNRDFAHSLYSFFGKPASMTLSSALDYILEKLDVLCRCGVDWANGMPLSQIFMSSCPVTTCLDKTRLLLLDADNLYEGLPEPGRKEMSVWYSETEDLLRDAEYLLENGGWSKKLESLKVEYQKLRTAKELINIKVSGENRMAPVGVVIAGSPGVGKSEIVSFVNEVMARTMGREYHPSMVYHRNATEQFWSNFQPRIHKIVHYSEPGSKHVNIASKVGDDITLEITSLIDSLPFPVNTPFDDKGKVFATPTMVILDTNNPSLNLEVLVNNPSAYKRRFLYIEPTVKRAFRKGDSCGIDSAKSLGDSSSNLLDRWLFRVYEQAPKDARLSLEKVLMLGEEGDDIYALTHLLSTYFKQHFLLQSTLRSVQSTSSAAKAVMDSCGLSLVSASNKQLADCLEDVATGKRNPESIPLYLRTAVCEKLDSFRVGGIRARDYIVQKGLESVLALWQRCSNTVLFNGVTTTCDDAGEEIMRFLNAPEEEKDYLLDEFRRTHEDEQEESYGGLSDDEYLAYLETRIDWAERNGYDSMAADYLISYNDTLYRLNREGTRTASNVQYNERGEELEQKDYEPVLEVETESAIVDGVMKIARSINEQVMDSMSADWPNFNRAFFRLQVVTSMLYEFLHTSLVTIEKAFILGCYGANVSTKTAMMAIVLSLGILGVLPLSTSLTLLLFCDLIPNHFMTEPRAALAQGFYVRTVNDIYSKWDRLWYKIKNFGKDKPLYKNGLAILGAGITTIGIVKYLIEAYTKKSSTHQAESKSDILAFQNSIDASDGSIRVPTVQNKTTWNTATNVSLPTCHRGDLESLQAAIGKNIVEVVIQGGKTLIGKTHILGVQSDFFLVNTHACSPEGFRVWYVRSGKLVEDFTTSSPNCYIDVHPHQIEDLGGDVTLITMCGFRKRDILKHITEGPVKDFTARPGLMLKQRLKVSKITHKVQLHGDDATYTMLDEIFTYEYPEHRKGLCGTPLLVEMSGTIHVAGFHVGANVNGDECFATVLDKKRIEEGIAKITARTSFLHPVSESYDFEMLKLPGPKSTFSHIPLPRLELLGTLEGPVLANQKSKVTKTLFHDEMLEKFSLESSEPLESFLPPLMQAKTVHGNYVSPYNIGYTKINSVRKQLNPHILAKCVDKYVSFIVKGLKKKGITKIQPLDLASAINGVADDPFTRGINMSTAGGFGFPGQKMKYFDIDFETKYRTPHAEIEEKVSHIFGKIRNGESSSSVYVGKLKDEPRLASKVAAGKTRLFFMSPLDLLLAHRMVLSPFYTLMVSDGDCFGSLLGTDMWKYGDEVYKNLTGFSPLLFEGDYGNYDQSMTYHIGVAAATVVYKVCKELGYNEEALKLVSGLLTDNLFPTVCILNDLVNCVAVQPSGKYATCEDNTLRGRLMKMYFFYSIREFINLDYFKVVYPLSYGDDVLDAVDASIVHAYNQVQYSHFCDEFLGISFTTSAKGDVKEEYTRPEDCSILKRKFRYKEDTECFVAQLNMSSIVRSLMWTIPSESVTAGEQMLGTLRSAMRELFLHFDRNKFNEFRDFFTDIFRDKYRGYEVELPEYDSYLEEYNQRYDQEVVIPRERNDDADDQL